MCYRPFYTSTVARSIGGSIGLKDATDMLLTFLRRERASLQSQVGVRQPESQADHWYHPDFVLSPRAFLQSWHSRLPLEGL